MAQMTLHDIYQAALRLPPEEREELIERLRAQHKDRQPSILDMLALDNVGPWPETLSLSREDMYGDDGR